MRLICPPLVLGILNFNARSGAQSGTSQKSVERWARVAENDGAGSGCYRNRLEHGAAFSPLKLSSHGLFLAQILRVTLNLNLKLNLYITSTDNLAIFPCILHVWHPQPHIRILTNALPQCSLCNRQILKPYTQNDYAMITIFTVKPCLLLLNSNNVSTSHET